MEVLSDHRHECPWITDEDHATMLAEIKAEHEFETRKSTSTVPLATLRVLERIAINVATHPSEKKYRRLDSAKPKIAQVSAIIECLEFYFMMCPKVSSWQRTACTDIYPILLLSYPGIVIE